MVARSFYIIELELHDKFNLQGMQIYCFRYACERKYTI